MRRYAVIRGISALVCALAFHAALVACAVFFGWFSPDPTTLPELDLTSIDLSFSETPDETAAPATPPPQPAVEPPPPPAPEPPPPAPEPPPPPAPEPPPPAPEPPPPPAPEPPPPAPKPPPPPAPESPPPAPEPPPPPVPEPPPPPVVQPPKPPPPPTPKAPPPPQVTPRPKEVKPVPKAPPKPTPAPKPQESPPPKPQPSVAIPPAPAPSQARIAVDKPPIPRRRIKPEYPRGARERGEEGDVTLELDISESGTVNDVRIIASCGFAELEQAAIQTVKHARFTPARRGNSKVPATARLTLTFRLKD